MGPLLTAARLEGRGDDLSETVTDMELWESGRKYRALQTSKLELERTGLLEALVEEESGVEAVGWQVWAAMATYIVCLWLWALRSLLGWLWWHWIRPSYQEKNHFGP